MRSTIRLFTGRDRDALRGLYLAARRHAFHWLAATDFQLEDFDRDTEGELIWVAAEGDRPVGFISVWEPENFIHNLFVHPDATGLGVGSALLDRSLDEIGRPATLKCLSQNKRAREFYLAKGWRIAAEGHGPDGLVLLMRFGDGGDAHGS